MQGRPIGTGGTESYELRRDPDGVDRVYRRLVPSSDDGTEIACRVDNGKAVIGVHRGHDVSVGILGRVAGVDIKQR